MVVVVKPVLAVVADKQVGPTVVVVIGNRASVAPAIVGHAGLRRDIGKRAIVVVMEERGVRRIFLAVQRIESRSVHKIDIEPAVVIVIDEAYAGAIRLDDEVLFRRAHLVTPVGEPSLPRDVFKD